MVQESRNFKRELKNKNRKHFFVSHWNFTKLVSNERRDQKESISGLFWGKENAKDSLVGIQDMFCHVFQIMSSTTQ